MAHMGLRLGQRANGVAQLHGRVSRSMFNNLWPGFDADEVPITSITNGVHAPTWMAREILDLAERAVGADALAAGDGWEAIDQVERRRAVGTQARTPRRGWCSEIRRRIRQSRPGARLLGDGTGLDRDRLRPGRAHHRLRPPGAVLQAADPDAARSGPAEATAHRPGAPDPDRGGRQVPSGRRRRQGTDRPAGPVHRRSRRSGTGSPSCPITTSGWPATCTGAATSG